jgi:hypothetical protein
MKKYILLSFLVLLLIAAGFYFFSKGDIDFSKEEENLVLKIDGKKITERDIEYYIREVSRDNFENNLSAEEIRSEAIDLAIMFVVVEKYYNKKNIHISQEEIESQIARYMAAQPGVETKEDFFRLVEMRGYSREEFLRDTEYFLKNRKLATIIAEGIDVSDEEALEEYTLFAKENSDKEFFPEFEDIKDIIKNQIAFDKAIEIIIEEINEEERMSDIVFFE